MEIPAVEHHNHKGRNPSHTNPHKLLHMVMSKRERLGIARIIGCRCDAQHTDNGQGDIEKYRLEIDSVEDVNAMCSSVIYHSVGRKYVFPLHNRQPAVVSPRPSDKTLRAARQ